MHNSFRLLPWLIVAGFAMLTLFFKFAIPGYSFTALVCLILGGIVTFYEITRILQPLFPKTLGILRTAVTVVLALGVTVCLVTEAVIIRYSFGDPDTEVSYMVVLGAKVRHDGPSVSLWDRIYAAAEYLEAHPDTVAVLSGGQGQDEPMTEAQAMYEELIMLGVDPDRLLIEDQATSTWENLHYSLEVIEEAAGQRPEKLGVLSSEYHLFRASLFTKACGAEFVGIPAKTSRPGQIVNHFMREVAGVWHYLLLGGSYES